MEFQGIQCIYFREDEIFSDCIIQAGNCSKYVDDRCNCKKYIPIYEAIAAVDYDGTLVVESYPEPGEPRWKIIEKVKRYQSKGVRLILWTCRTGALLEEAVARCRNEFGIKFDAINCNLESSIKKYGDDSRKIFAHIYLDDKAVLADDFISSICDTIQDLV